MAVVTLDDDWEFMEERRKEILINVLGKDRASKLIDIPEKEEDIKEEDLLEIIENAGTLENDGQ